jgi:outer membrane protein TolC
MSHQYSRICCPRRRAVVRVLAPLVTLSLTLLHGQCAGAAQPQAAQVPTGPATPTMTVSKVTLAECLAMASHQQPRVATARASLAVAEDAYRAIEALRLLNCLDPEIGVRRRQACLGLTAASANLERTERETAFAVTRAYVTVLFAREQERVARTVIERLSKLGEVGQRMVDAGSNKVTSYDVKRSAIYVRLAESQRIQAEQGAERALGALREAIGVGCGVMLDVVPGLWTEPLQRLCREDIVALALGHRGELVQASVFVDVTCLEVEAQGTCCMPKRMDTFAASVDIHALAVAQEINGNEYRPGAIPPEMPVSLAGARPERMRRAQDLNCRARAALDVIRGLIVLDAEDAFLRWEQASRQVAELSQAVSASDKLADDLASDFNSGLSKMDEVTNSRVLAAQTRGQYNEALHKEFLALADLERATGGAFSAGLAEMFNPATGR